MFLLHHNYGARIGLKNQGCHTVTSDITHWRYSVLTAITSHVDREVEALRDKLGSASFQETVITHSCSDHCRYLSRSLVSSAQVAYKSMIKFWKVIKCSVSIPSKENTYHGILNTKQDTSLWYWGMREECYINLHFLQEPSRTLWS